MTFKYFLSVAISAWLEIFVFWLVFILSLLDSKLFPSVVGIVSSSYCWFSLFPFGSFNIFILLLVMTLWVFFSVTITLECWFFQKLKYFLIGIFLFIIFLSIIKISSLFFRPLNLKSFFSFSSFLILFGTSSQDWAPSIFEIFSLRLSLWELITLLDGVDSVFWINFSSISFVPVFVGWAGRVITLFKPSFFPFSPSFPLSSKRVLFLSLIKNILFLVIIFFVFDSLVVKLKDFFPLQISKYLLIIVLLVSYEFILDSINVFIFNLFFSSSSVSFLIWLFWLSFCFISSGFILIFEDSFFSVCLAPWTLLIFNFFFVTIVFWVFSVICCFCSRVKVFQWLNLFWITTVNPENNFFFSINFINFGNFFLGSIAVVVSVLDTAVVLEGVLVWGLFGVLVGALIGGFVAAFVVDFDRSFPDALGAMVLPVCGLVVLVEIVDPDLLIVFPLSFLAVTFGIIFLPESVVFLSDFPSFFDLSLFDCIKKNYISKNHLFKY